MKTQPRDEIVDLFLQQIRKELGSHLKQVILFGSRARGDAAPDSDYDFLAIVDEATPPIVGQIDEVVGEILYETNAVLSVFAVSETRFKTQTFNPLFRNVQNEGIPL
jgi:predicted nucleotidyltransferase